MLGGSEHIYKIKQLIRRKQHKSSKIKCLFITSCKMTFYITLLYFDIFNRIAIGNLLWLEGKKLRQREIQREREREREGEREREMHATRMNARKSVCLDLSLHLHVQRLPRCGIYCTLRTRFSALAMWIPPMRHNFRRNCLGLLVKIHYNRESCL